MHLHIRWNMNYEHYKPIKYVGNVFFTCATNENEVRLYCSSSFDCLWYLLFFNDNIENLKYAMNLWQKLIFYMAWLNIQCKKLHRAYRTL